MDIVIGRGKFSVIYLDSHLGLSCAFKNIDTKENSRRYVRNEVEILKALKGCEHIVQLVDYKISRDGYVKYERLDKTLLECIGYIDANRIKSIALDLMKAVTEMHSRGVVHCDLKPENIMFDYNGTLKIIDFGNALFIDDLSTTEQSIGTLYYRPPEYIIKAPLDYRVDYWAVGCILMELLIESPLFLPKRDNEMYVHSYILGQMIMVLGDFPNEFISSGTYAHKYFDTEHPNNTYRFKHLLGKRTSLYRILRNSGYDKPTALYWSDFITPLFNRG